MLFRSSPTAVFRINHGLVRPFRAWMGRGRPTRGVAPGWRGPRCWRLLALRQPGLEQRSWRPRLRGSGRNRSLQWRHLGREERSATGVKKTPPRERSGGRRSGGSRAQEDVKKEEALARGSEEEAHKNRPPPSHFKPAGTIEFRIGADSKAQELAHAFTRPNPFHCRSAAAWSGPRNPACNRSR